MLPVLEREHFTANTVFGEPLQPYQLHAGNIIVGTDVEGRMTITRSLSEWLGTESLRFILRDINTLHEYSDTSIARFTVVVDAFGNAQTDITFGDIPVTTTVRETVKVVNQGIDRLIISSAGIDVSDYTVHPTSAYIAVGDSVNFIVNFTPSSSGDKSGNLTFLHNAYRSPRVLALHGSGQYVRVVASINANGSITPLGTSLVNYGASQHYQIVPDHGYRIDSVVVNGINLGVLTEYEFTDVRASQTIAAYCSIIPAYGVSYRTATAYDWATAVDQRGRRRAIVRRYDKIMFEFPLTADATRHLSLKFNINVQGIIVAGGDTLATISGTRFEGDLSQSLAQGDVIRISGVGDRGRYITSYYGWGTNPLKPVLNKEYTSIRFGYPLPNLHNVGKELFGIGQRNSAIPGGLRVGVPQGAKGGNAVVHTKYSDVMKSLAVQSDTGWILHTKGPRCLDVFISGKPISSRQRSIAPTKQNNILIGEAIALKMNIIASAAGKFPTGFGELTYNDTTQSLNPFNGMMVKDISMKADTMLSCLSFSSTPATPEDLYDALNAINAAFRTNGILDTISFFKSTKLTGAKRLVDVLYMKATTDAIAATIDLDDNFSTDDLPMGYRLRQNYPNPFNPTTTIEYELPATSHVIVTVYNVLGQVVSTLVKEIQEEGVQSIDWDATAVPSGVYFYRLEASSVSNPRVRTVLTDKMVVLK